jgi:hypothetical protein
MFRSRRVPQSLVTIVFCLIAGGWFGETARGKEPKVYPFGHWTHDIEVKLVVDHPTIRVEDPVGFKVVVTNKSKTDACLPAGLGMVGMTTYLRREGEQKKKSDDYRISQYESSHPHYAAFHLKAGSQCVDHFLLWTAGREWRGEGFVFPAEGKYTVWVDCWVAEDFSFEDRYGYVGVLPPDNVVTTQRISNKVKIDVTGAYDPKVFAPLNQKAKDDGGLEFISWRDVRVDTWAAEMSDLAHRLPADSLCREAIMDRVYIAKVRHQEDQAAALQVLFDRAARKRPVDRGLFAARLAEHLASVPVGEENYGISRKHPERAIEIDEAYFDAAEKLMNAFLKEQGEERYTLLASINEGRHQSALRRDYRTIAAARKNPDKVTGMLRMLERVESRPADDRYATAIFFANKVLDGSADDVFRRPDIEAQYVDFAEKLLHSYIKKEGEYRTNVVQTIRERRIHLERVNEQPAIQEFRRATDKDAAFGKLMAIAEKKELAQREHFAIMLTRQLLDTTHEEVFNRPELQARYFDYAKQVMEKHVKGSSDEKARFQKVIEERRNDEAARGEQERKPEAP